MTSTVKRLAAQAAGWFLVWLWPAYQLVQLVSAVDFLQRLLSADVAAFLASWGWVVLIPLGLGILWRAEASRAEAVARTRDFKAACMDLVRAGFELEERLANDPDAAVIAQRLGRRTHRAMEVLIDSLPKAEGDAMNAAKRAAGWDLIEDAWREDQIRDELGLDSE